MPRNNDTKIKSVSLSAFMVFPQLKRQYFNMNALKEVFIYEFYRRNYLFFLLILIFLVFVVRPPSILVSPYFVIPMLESLTFLGIVMTLLILYYIKCTYEVYKTIHHPQNRFLYQLAALPVKERYVIVLKQLAGVTAPALIYMGVIAGYSIIQHTWHIYTILGFNLIWFSLVTHLLSLELGKPKEHAFRKGIQAWLTEKMKNSLALIYALVIWNQHRLAYLIGKGVSIILLGALLYGQSVSPMVEKGVFLSFLAIACLQGVLAFWMVESVDTQFYVLKNLPIPRYQRFFQFIGATLILWIPEGLMIGIFLGFFELPLLWIVHELMAILVIYLLSISLLTYQKLILTQYLVYLFWFFVGAFFVLIFGVSPFILYGICGCLAWAMFWEEFYK